MVLVALGVYYSRRSRYWQFFAGLGFFALTLSLGGNTPLYRLYYAVLPGLKRFRAPDLAYYVLGMSLVIMAAITLERLAALREERAARRGASEGAGPFLPIAGGVVAFAVVGAMLFGSASAGMAEGTTGLTPAQGWMRFALFAAAVAAALWMWWERRISTRSATLILAVVTVADLWMIGKKFLETTPAPEVEYAQDEVTAFLKSQRGPFRFWAIEGQSAWPRYKNGPMWYGLENAAGEHGNQLQRYNEFAGPGERTYVDFHNFNDPRFLAAANIRYIVISAELQLPSSAKCSGGRRRSCTRTRWPSPAPTSPSAPSPCARAGPWRRCWTRRGTRPSRRSWRPSGRSPSPRRRSRPPPRSRATSRTG
jgi:hypothetical protein